jgi:hypothetical protein
MAIGFPNRQRALLAVAPERDDRRVSQGACPSGVRLMRHLQIESLNVSHFVARHIWQKRRVSPRHGRAHRLQRHEPLQGLLVLMDRTCDALQTALN